MSVLASILTELGIALVIVAALYAVLIPLCWLLSRAWPTNPTDRYEKKQRIARKERIDLEKRLAARWGLNSIGETHYMRPRGNSEVDRVTKLKEIFQVYAIHDIERKVLRRAGSGEGT